MKAKKQAEKAKEVQQDVDLLDHSSLTLMLISFALFFVLLLTLVFSGGGLSSTRLARHPNIRYHAANDVDMAVLGASKQIERIDRSTIAGSIKYAKLSGPSVLGISEGCARDSVRASINCAKAMGSKSVLGKAVSRAKKVGIDRSTLAGSMLHARLMGEGGSSVLGASTEVDKSTIGGSIQFAKTMVARGL